MSGSMVNPHNGPENERYALLGEYYRFLYVRELVFSLIFISDGVFR